MKKIAVYSVLLACLVIVSLTSCMKKEPVKIWFRNLKCCDTVTESAWKTAYDAVDKDTYAYGDYYVDCLNGITKKQGVVWVCDFEKPINTDKVSWQLIDASTGAVYSTDEGKSDPEMRSWQTYTNLPYRGKFIINLLAEDDIIASGQIEYK